jgi:hypothetical protein
MCKIRNSMLLGCLLAGACLAPLAAQANPIVSMVLTGAQGSSLNGIYTDPYYGDIGPAGLTSPAQFTAQNSFAASIYCDDFYDNVSTGQVWQARVTNLGSLSLNSPDSTLMFDGSSTSQAAHYMAAAWLAEQIGGGKLSSSQAELDSYALWYLFDPSALAGLSSGDSGAAQLASQTALTAVENDTPTDFSNVNIYTPLDSTPGSASSQEYLTVSAPEPSTLSLALLAVAAVGFAASRRRRQVI